MTPPATGTTAVDRREDYLNHLLSQATQQGERSLPLSSLRDTAKALVREQTFPSTRDEEWRFTDLSAMMQLPFQAVETVGKPQPDLSSLTLAETASSRLVFINGRYAAELSSTQALPSNVVVGSFSQLYGQDSLGASLEERLGQQFGSNEVFTALNTVGFADAAVIWVPRNQILEVPIQLIQISLPGETPTLGHPRCLVVAESGSAVTLVESFGGSGGDHFTNSVTEMWVEPTAQLKHVRLQREGDGVFHVGKTAVSQGRDSQYDHVSVTLGGRLCRHHLEVYQTGEQTTTRLYGLDAIATNQVADTHSLIALTHPHGYADQLHKSIIDDHAHAIFNGKIQVPHEAQLTTASQLNRNLLLSGKGRVNTKPQLEIVADNVKCAHGATVSQLDADEVFYLQSRGIQADQAQRLLLYGFAIEIINHIPLESLRQVLTATMTAWTR
ncbi:FeS cluster assembly protein SufD [Halomicronema hongdechloris C2206]|uniref:FeS cluster assembly protein SufD n=1 Tax=Halomicronema hongdechloris C2206 TaxID=1641165 RepID=A0A1Z3HVC3_9CYAN|nr:Fe-S cluster assembly protein SufD [Halomicronema hongdechloris]ASC74249.1 FeS cluster assembly protein SufD [Halomicronema hongdechloris C2206]